MFLAWLSDNGGEVCIMLESNWNSYQKSLNYTEKTVMNAIGYLIHEVIIKKYHKVDLKFLEKYTQVPMDIVEKIINGDPYVSFEHYLKVILFLEMNIIKLDEGIIKNPSSQTFPIIDFRNIDI